MNRSTLVCFLALGVCIAGCHTRTAASASANKSVGTVSQASFTGNRGPLAATLGIYGGLDDQDRKVLERTCPRTVDRMDRGEPLTINDVIRLSQAGVTDEAIIGYMQQNNSTYSLGQGQMRRLQDAGVSQRVIDFMVDSGK